MSLNDIAIKRFAGYNCVPSFEWLRDDRDTSSQTATTKAGEPLKVNATAGQFCILLVDADLTIGTDQPFVGVAAEESTETASVDGAVNAYMPLPGVVYEVKALSAAAADTQSEIDALRGEYDVLDLTSGKFTLDTVAGTGANNAFLIVGGDPLLRSLWVMIRSDATIFGRGSV